jgi:hypothetical protein
LVHDLLQLPQVEDCPQHRVGLADLAPERRWRPNGINAALAIRAAMPECTPLLIALTGFPGNSLDGRLEKAFDVAMLKPPDMDKLLGHLATL